MNASEPVELVLLETFHEIAREGSLTAAAKRLGRSQPAISHRLRALEEALGVPLFEKFGRGLRMTPYGVRLQERCVELMALSRGLREAVTEPADHVAGQVTIGCLPTLTAHLLVDAVAALLDRWPRLRIGFRYALAPELCERLRTGRLDVVILTGAEATADLATEVIDETALVAVMAPARAPKAKICSTSWLTAQRYLAWGGPRDATFDVIERFAESARLVDASTPSIPHIESLRALAAAGAGFTILPEYTTRRDVAAGRLVTRRLRGLDVSMPITLVGRERQVETRALAVVKDALRSL